MNNHIDVFTAQAISGLKHASKLATRTAQKSIRGDDIFFGVINVLKQHNLFEVFALVLALPHAELCGGEMGKKYHLDDISLMEEKRLPLSKKLSEVIQEMIDQKHIKKLDL